MATDAAPAAAPRGAATLTTAHEPASFEERWAAWEARGTAHDRAVRRRFVVAAPILLVLAAVLMYIIAGR